MFPFTICLLHNTILNNVNIALDFYLFLIFQSVKKQYYLFLPHKQKKKKDTKFSGFVSFQVYFTKSDNFSIEAIFNNVMHAQTDALYSDEPPPASCP